MQVRGEVHSQGSWCVVQLGSGLLPSFSSLMLSHRPVLPPSQCCGWWRGHVQLSRSSRPFSSLLACVHLLWSSMFFWSLWCPKLISCRDNEPLQNASFPSSSFSIANSMFADIWLRCVWNGCRFCSPWGQMS